MKTVYLLIGVFFTWCIIASFWYLFWIKGLNPHPENINPHQSGLAIAEILIIILVSVLIGFGLAWILKGQQTIKKEQEIQNLLIDLAALHASNQQLQEQTQRAESTLERARTTFREDFLAASRENEKLKVELGNVPKENPADKIELARLQREVQSLQGQLDKSKQEISQLESTRQKLETDLEELQKYKREHKEPTIAEILTNQKAGTKISADEKDDLKVISGIGPAIEKKLNKIGIHSYRQISEFSEESIKQITASIKFFPGRIDRDRWVEQASKLYLDKIRK